MSEAINPDTPNFRSGANSAGAEPPTPNVAQHGGAYIEGSVAPDGDFGGRDQGDQSISVGNVSGMGIAIGHGAIANVTLVQPLPQVTALHQLPSPPADFTGREAELAELWTAFESGGLTLLGLQGMGGVGKTVLALTLADKLKDRYPAAQFFVDLQGAGATPLTPAAVLALVIRAYHPEARLPESEGELRGLYLSVLHGQRALLLLDNAHEAAQVQPLLPPASCMLLVTSRQHFTLPGLCAINLDCLPPADAGALLLKIAPRIGRRADELAGLCGYLPLALRVAGSLLAEQVDLSVGDYLRRLEKAKTRMGLVEASLSLSYDSLTPAQQQLWSLLAVFPAAFDRAAVGAVWELDDESAQEALSELVKFGLVEYDALKERYRLHDLARLFADARLNERTRGSGQARHARHYAGVLRTANELYLQGGDSILRGLALFDLELANLQAGQAWAAARADEDEAAARLCSDYAEAGIDCLELRLHPHQQIQWLEAGLAAARRLNDRSQEGIHLGYLGWAYAALGMPRRAIEFYEQQLTLARAITDRREEGQALGNLGIAFATLGEFHRALEYHQQQLALTREIGDRRREGQALGSLGVASAALGELRRAIEYHQQQLTLTRAIGDRRGESQALGSLGVASAALGELRRAIEYHGQQLTLTRAIGDRRGEGQALGSLGVASAALGELRRAIEYHEQQLTLTREIGDRRGEGQALGSLGVASAALGELRRAIEYHEQQLMITREIGDRRGEGETLGSLGIAFAALGELRRAIAYHEQQLTLTREIGDRRGESQALGSLGTAFTALGEPRRAIAYHERQLTITREIGDRRGEGEALGNLGRAFAVLGELRRAGEYYEQQLTITRETGDRKEEGQTLFNMSLVLDQLGNRRQAIAQTQSALTIFEQVEDPRAAQARQQLARWANDQPVSATD